jgi:hypothetical protein
VRIHLAPSSYSLGVKCAFTWRQVHIHFAQFPSRRKTYQYLHRHIHRHTHTLSNIMYKCTSFRNSEQSTISITNVTERNIHVPVAHTHTHTHTDKLMPGSRHTRSWIHHSAFVILINHADVHAYIQLQATATQWAEPLLTRENSTFLVTRNFHHCLSPSRHTTD